MVEAASAGFLPSPDCTRKDTEAVDGAPSMPKGEAMFEICLVFASGRSSLFRRDSLIDARETAREAASVTGNKVEIVDRQTGDVVERHEPPKLPELGRRSALDRMASEEPRQRETALPSHGAYVPAHAREPVEALRYGENRAGASAARRAWGRNLGAVSEIARRFRVWARRRSAPGHPSPNGGLCGVGWPIGGP